LQELRWVLKDTINIDLQPPVRKTIDLEGRIVKDGVAKRLGIDKVCSPIRFTPFG
jgi:hypothetical protein